jgi:hypothetical protein
MGFRELFELAKGRLWTPEEERAFGALGQEARNQAVRELAGEAGVRGACVRVEDRLGTDGVVYSAFWREQCGEPGRGAEGSEPH